MIDVLLEAARSLKRALPLVDVDVRSDERFSSRGVLIPVEAAETYGARDGEVFDAVSKDGQPRKILFIRVKEGE